MNDLRRKNSGRPRGRGGRGVWGEFRRARAFRRSEAEAVSFVQRRFEQSCIIPPLSNFPIFARPIRPREARKGMETLARRTRHGSPSAGSSQRFLWQQPFSTKGCYPLRFLRGFKRLFFILLSVRAHPSS